MKNILILAALLMLIFIESCSNNITTPIDLYSGERMYNGNINFTFPKSIGYSDTFSITTTIPNQSYRMKGHISLFVSGTKESAILLLSPSAFKGENSYDTSDMKDSYSRINVEFFPNQGFTQVWKFVADSALIFKNQLNESIQFYAFLKIDSIYLDMDSLYYPSSLDIPPYRIPEKKWYDCNFSHFSSEQALNDTRLLLRYFNSQNWESTLFSYIYYKK